MCTYGYTQCPKINKDLCNSLWLLRGQVSLYHAGQRSETGWHNSNCVFIPFPPCLPSSRGYSLVLGQLLPTFGCLASLAHTAGGLPVSLPGVTEMLWIGAGVCSALSAGHWHVRLTSARPRHSAPHWRHYADSTFGLPWKQGEQSYLCPNIQWSCFPNSDFVSHCIYVYSASSFISFPLLYFFFFTLLLSICSLCVTWQHSAGNSKFEILSRGVYPPET